MFRRIFHFHDNERLIAMAQTPAGRGAVILAAAILLLWHDGDQIYRFDLDGSYVYLLLAVGAMMIFPRRVRLIASLASLAMMVSAAMSIADADWSLTSFDPNTDEFNRFARAAALIAGLWAILFGVLFIAQRLERLPDAIRHHPVLAFHTLLIAGLIILAIVPVLSPLIGLVWLVPLLMWRISYLLLDASRAKISQTGFFDHLFYLLPTWGGESLPVGKGFDYLDRHQSRSAADIARTQLSGLRLIGIGIAWFWLRQVMETMLYATGSVSISFLNDYSLQLSPLINDIENAHDTVFEAWAGVYLELFRVVLQTAAWGAIIVGGVRLLGFDIFRNTYKPLLAESVVDFWGRYSYYFKEVCLDFFFYPVFLRCGWAGPRLRLFLAIFAAAFVGNMYFHLLMYPDRFLLRDWALLWAYWSPRIIYCLLLTFGIWVSMLRQQKLRGASSVAPTRGLRARRIFLVWTFYAVIYVFNFGNANIGIRQRLDFCATLLGF